MCEILRVSRSSYYRWLTGGISKRKGENQKLMKEIKDIHRESKQTYGSPRVAKELSRRGFAVSRRKVAKMMRQEGLQSKIRKKYRVTTNSNHRYPAAENHLNRNFSPGGLNQAWVSDITYIKTAQGWLYLTVILDLCDRQVIGWSLSRRLHTKDTVIPAWKMAASRRKIASKLIFHSDRGVQYACNDFKKLIANNPNVMQSMSRKGNCWDNAVAESFFKTLKVECVYLQKFRSMKEAELSIFEFIEIWYNRKRIHSALGYRTPAEFETFFFYLKNVA
jgi:transposase InsO family protein